MVSLGPSMPYKEMRCKDASMCSKADVVVVECCCCAEVMGHTSLCSPGYFTSSSVVSSGMWAHGISV